MYKACTSVNFNFMMNKGKGERKKKETLLTKNRPYPGEKVISATRLDHFVERKYSDREAYSTFLLAIKHN